MKTIAAAEAWAIYKVFALTPDRRTVYTDCLSNVNIAYSGCKAATAANNATARIWRLIYCAVDGELAPEQLLWMPAHKARGQIGKALKSDGTAITALDWLGNMAVDELAKSAAKASRSPEIARNRITQARINALGWRCRLGRVTHASQNFPVIRYDDRGEAVPSLRRDSDGKPQAPDKGEADE